jgi:hypothetical protein
VGKDTNILFITTPGQVGSLMLLHYNHFAIWKHLRSSFTGNITILYYWVFSFCDPW